MLEFVTAQKPKPRMFLEPGENQAPLVMPEVFSPEYLENLRQEPKPVHSGCKTSVGGESPLVMPEVF